MRKLRVNAGWVLGLSCVVQGISWLLVGGLQVTLHVGVPAFFGGMPVPQDLALGLCMLALIGIPTSAAAIVIWAIWWWRQRRLRHSGRTLE